MFNVRDKFFIEEFPIKLIDLHEKRQLYIKRPPYQRKNVWSKAKHHAIDEGITFSELLERALKNEMKEKKKK